MEDATLIPLILWRTDAIFGRLPNEEYNYLKNNIYKQGNDFCVSQCWFEKYKTRQVTELKSFSSRRAVIFAQYIEDRC